jgi:hypothetical protein
VARSFVHRGARVTASSLGRLRGARDVPPVQMSPGLRVLFDRGVRRRGLVAHGIGLAARLGMTSWNVAAPDAGRPAWVASPGDVRAATWYARRVLDRSRAQRMLGHATWLALRSRDALRGAPSRRSLDVAARALGRPLDRPTLVLVSPSFAANRVTCFVFERREADPAAVIRAMADPRRSDELVAELRFLARLRHRTWDDPLYDTLPAAPLAVDDAGGDVLVVEGYDPLAAPDGDAASALAWLARFQAVLANDGRSLSAAETDALLARVAAGWRAAGCSDALPSMGSALERLARAVGDIEVPRCAVHGDFWRGNIGGVDDRLRVYDWEWSREDGLPTFDLWTYILADVRLRGPDGADREAALTQGLATATAHLRAAGVPAELATLTIAPTLADLALRGAERSGRRSDILGDRWLFDAVSRHVVRSAPPAR